MPTRVLDLGLTSQSQDIRLIESSSLPGPSKYAALTYCWGPPDVIFKTTLANWDKNKSRIEFSKLNRLFRETITLLRSLDIQYLWIDSICIVQNDVDNRDWKREAPKMAMVYSNAFLTVSADASTRADDALFAGLVSEPSQMGPDIPFTDMEMELTQCTLSTRGWCLQERCLSRRIVHFGTDLMFWECAGEAYSEHKVQRYSSRRHDLNPAFKLLLGPHGFHGDSTRDPYQQWYKLMYDYTQRGLTVKGDKETAILGLIDVFKKTTNDTPVSGLWKKDLPNGLAWFRCRDSPSVPPDDIQTSTMPSWSWLGVSGNVLWPGMAFEVQSALRDVSVDDPDITSITLQGKLSSYGSPTSSDLDKFEDGEPKGMLSGARFFIYWDCKPTPECLPRLFHPDGVNSRKIKNVWILVVSHVKQDSSRERSYGLMLVRAESPNTDPNAYQRVGFIRFRDGTAARDRFDVLPWQTINLR